MIMNIRLRHISIAALAALVLLAACGARQVLAQDKPASTLKGRYSVPGPGGMVMEFHPDGTVVAHDGNGNSEPLGTYTCHGTDVELLNAQGASMAHLLVDAQGCLHGKEQPQKVLCPQPVAAGSSQAPSGTYSTKDGTMKFTFKSGGKVEFEAGGTLQEGTYRVEDGKVKFFDMQRRGAVMNVDGDNRPVSTAEFLTGCASNNKEMRHDQFDEIQNCGGIGRRAVAGGVRQSRKVGPV